MNLRLNRKKELGILQGLNKEYYHQFCKAGFQEYFCEEILLCFGSKNTVF